MNYNQFSNLSCYEEFEIQSVLTGISKVDILKEFGHKINDYYFFLSEDGIFNWFDLEGNHVENPRFLKDIKLKHISRTITKCNIPDSVTSINIEAFWNCKSLKEIIIPDSVTSIGAYAFHNCNSLKEVIFKGKTLDEVKQMENYSWDINDESIIKCKI